MGRTCEMCEMILHQTKRKITDTDNWKKAEYLSIYILPITPLLLVFMGKTRRVLVGLGGDMLATVEKLETRVSQDLSYVTPLLILVWIFCIALVF